MIAVDPAPHKRFSILCKLVERCRYCCQVRNETCGKIDQAEEAPHFSSIRRFTGISNSLHFNIAGPIPRVDNTWPINTKCDILNWHLSRFNVSPFLLNTLTTFSNLLSCSSSVGAWTITSSRMLWTPWHSCRTWPSTFWYISVAQLIPNVSRLNRYSPWCVPNVVISLDSGDKLYLMICRVKVQLAEELAPVQIL